MNEVRENQDEFVKGFSFEGKMHEEIAGVEESYDGSGVRHDQ